MTLFSQVLAINHKLRRDLIANSIDIGVHSTIDMIVVIITDKELFGTVGTGKTRTVWVT